MSVLVPEHAIVAQAEVFGGGFFIVWLALVIAVLAGVWKAFEKAGEPGWGALVPFYNFYLMLRIGGNPGWYLLLGFVPLVNIWLFYRMFTDVAKAFGQGVGFGLGLWFLGMIFWPLLGFGDFQYQGVPEPGEGAAA